MTKTTQNTPNTLADETLDEVSGGPHFKTWNTSRSSLQAAPKTEARTKSAAVWHINEDEG